MRRRPPTSASTATRGPARGTWTATGCSTRPSGPQWRRSDWKTRRANQVIATCTQKKSTHLRYCSRHSTDGISHTRLPKKPPQKHSVSPFYFSERQGHPAHPPASAAAGRVLRPGPALHEPAAAASPGSAPAGRRHQRGPLLPGHAGLLGRRGQVHPQGHAGEFTGRGVMEMSYNIVWSGMLFVPTTMQSLGEFSAGLTSVSCIFTMFSVNLMDDGGGGARRKKLFL